MSWVILIDSHDESAKQIEEALTQLDASTKTLRFANTGNLTQWLTQLAKKETEALALLPEGTLKGVITSAEGWTKKDLDLFEKIKGLFVQLKLTVDPETIFILLTGHKLGSEQKKKFEKSWVDNFISKPFDKLMLKQLIDIAWNRHKKVATTHIHRFKTDLTIEMLKEIRISEMTEIGFQTMSDQKIEIGKIAKYYADFLETNQHRSAFARAVGVEELPGTKTFWVDLGFFALDQQQSFNLQKLIQARNTTRPLLRKPGSPEKFEFHFIEAEKSDLCQQIRPSVERFMDHSLVSLKQTADLTKVFKVHADKGVHPHIVLFLDASRCFGTEVEECQAIAAMRKDISIFVLSKKIFPEAKESQLSQVCEDIFYAPFNRSYILKTIKRRWPSLITKEELYEGHDEMDRTMYASNPVKMVEVSEAGLVMEYYRPLPVGSYREFIFWLPVEIDIPTIIAQCTYTEPSGAGKSLYHCHFTFFGTEDHHLKHMRKWMLHNYIDKKSGH